MFFRLVTSVGQRKILSPHEESNLRPSDLRSDALPLSHKDSSVSGVYYDKTKKHLSYFFTELKTYYLYLSVKNPRKCLENSMENVNTDVRM